MQSKAFVRTLLPLVLLLSADLLWCSEDVRLLSVDAGSLCVEYYVPRHLLCSTSNIWNDVTQPFPDDLRRFVRTAEQYLVATREIAGDLMLIGITIQQRTDSCKDTSFGPPVEWSRCYIVVSFQSRTPERKVVGGDELMVVMLLDGTIAKDRLVRGTFAFPQRGVPQQRSGEPSSTDVSGRSNVAREGRIKK